MRLCTQCVCTVQCTVHVPFCVYVHMLSVRFYLTSLQRINITAIQCTDLFFYRFCFFASAFFFFTSHSIRVSAFSFSLNIQIFNLPFVLCYFCRCIRFCDPVYPCRSAFWMFFRIRVVPTRSHRKPFRSLSFIAYGIPTAFQKYQLQSKTTTAATENSIQSKCGMK